MDRILPFDELLGMLRRRFALFALVAVLGSAVALAYALSLPRLYRATAVIQIESPALSENVMASTEASAALQQLQRTEQRLMARKNLISVIERHDLFKDSPAMSMNDRVFALRKATSIEQVTNPALQYRPDVSPTALTITVQLGDPEKVAAVTNDFVDSVLAQNRARREERVRESLAFFASEEERVGAEIAALDSEIAGFKSRNADALPDAVGGKRGQLAALEDSDLALERQLIELTGNGTAGRANVARQIARIEEQRAIIAARRQGLEAAIARAPEVEKSLNTLTRRRAVLEEQFAIITRNRAEAEMGQMLESSRNAENYEILELAQVPEYPVAPSRKKVFLAGVAASFALAGLLVYLLESLHPVIRTAAQMKRRLDITPVVVIPTVRTFGDVTRRRLGRSVALLALAVGLPLALWLVDSYVYPVENLAQVKWLEALRQVN